MQFCAQKVFLLIIYEEVAFQVKKALFKRKE